MFAVFNNIFFNRFEIAVHMGIKFIMLQIGM